MGLHLYIDYICICTFVNQLSISGISPPLTNSSPRLLYLLFADNQTQRAPSEGWSSSTPDKEQKLLTYTVFENGITKKIRFNCPIVYVTIIISIVKQLIDYVLHCTTAKSVPFTNIICFNNHKIQLPNHVYNNIVGNPDILVVTCHVGTLTGAGWDS